MACNRRSRLLLLTACVTLWAGGAEAQPRAPKPVALELRQVAEVPTGRIAAREGVADSEGLRFAIPDLSVLQPVEVLIAALDPSQPLRVEVTKFGFDGPLRQAVTDPDGQASLRFRTEQGVTLTVKSASSSRARFQLATWVGDELTTVAARVLTPMTDEQRERSSLPTPPLYAAAGALVTALAVVVFLRGRKMTTRALCLGAILALAPGGVATAGGFSKEITFKDPAISGLLRSMAGELAGALETKELDDMNRISGALRHDDAAPGSFEVLLNGHPAQLPVVTARGTLGDTPVSLVVLDDPLNPLALSWKIGDHNDLRVVQIHFPAGTDSSGEGRLPAEAIGSLLEAEGRVAVYGIYFDFASHTIKPESEPVLKEIATVLNEHADWTLFVEGHTDGIGDTASNRELSERRAAAVKSALVERYAIGAARLETAGFGESRPRASNDTLEGRAQNRRVELVRR